MKQSVVIALVLVALWLYLSDKQKGAIAGGARNVYEDPAFEEPEIMELCDNPSALVWNPLAAPHDSYEESTFYCGGLVNVDYSRSDLGQMGRQYSICSSDPEGRVGVIRKGPKSYRDDTISHCMMGETWLGNITDKAYLMGEEGTFPNSARSASTYVAHGNMDNREFRGTLGNVENGDTISIARVYNGMEIDLQLLRDTLWVPREILFEQTPNEFIHHPSYERLISNIDAYMNGVGEGLRKVGDPSMPHPIDLDLDNSGYIPSPSKWSQHFLPYTPEQNEEMMILGRDYMQEIYFEGGTIDVEEVDEKDRKIARILDANKDGIIDMEDMMFWIRLASPPTAMDLIPPAQMNESVNLLFYQGNTDYNSYFPNDATFLPTSIEDNWAASLYGRSELELCYNHRHAESVYILEDGTTSDYSIDGECGRLRGEPPYLDRWDTYARFETLYGMDGMACGNDVETLCFQFSEEEMAAEYERYMSEIRQSTGADLSSQGFDNAFFPIQISPNLRGDLGPHYLSEHFNNVLKSEAQCPESHPDFKRFCLTRRTMPELVRTPSDYPDGEYPIENVHNT